MRAKNGCATIMQGLCRASCAAAGSWASLWTNVKKKQSCVKLAPLKKKGGFCPRCLHKPAIQPAWYRTTMRNGHRQNDWKQLDLATELKAAP
jgi:hypothetical protein